MLGCTIILRFTLGEMFPEVSTQVPIFRYAVVTSSAYRGGGSRVFYRHVFVSVFMTEPTQRKQFPNINICKGIINYFVVEERGVAWTMMFLYGGVGDILCLFIHGRNGCVVWA